ncbi:MAG: hypothetical protein AAGG00_14855, partial [Cyanobacteria bacterium P01_H01_bin.150]
ASVTKQLLKIANNENGHDNVTIACMHCQTKYSEPKSALEVSLADISSISVADSSYSAAVTQNLPNQKTQVITEKADSQGLKLPLILGIFGLLTLVTAGLVGLWKSELLSFNLDSGKAREVNEKAGKAPQSASNPQTPAGGTNPQSKKIVKGLLIEAKTDLDIREGESPSHKTGYAPAGSVLKLLINKDSDSQKSYSLLIEVCSVGGEQGRTNSPGSKPSTGVKTTLKRGERVWLKMPESELFAQKKAVLIEKNSNNQCPTAGNSDTNVSSTSETREDSSKSPQTEFGPQQQNPLNQ